MINVSTFLKKIVKKTDQTMSEDNLIVFDKKVILLLLISFVAFVLLVSLRIHTSSIPIWSQIMPNEKSQNDGLIIGAPRETRSDEWVVSTPYSLSQAKASTNFNLENDNLGAGKPSLLTNVPVMHISTVFRPQFWGYFFLNSERGFSFFWLAKYLALFISFFLLLMLVTKNNFLLSFIGSLWLLFSSFTQWWFSTTLPEMLSSLFFLFIGFVYILRSQRRYAIYLGGILSAFSMINFTLSFYPPYQITLGYLFIFLFIGYIFSEGSIGEIKTHLKERLFVLAGSLSVFGVVLYRFYVDAKETIQITMNTVYPGKRRSLGGGLTLNKYFVGFYNFAMSESRFPTQISPNMSEISAFVLYFPIALLAAVANFIQKKKNNLMMVMMLSYIFLLTWYLVVGFPGLLNNILFFSFVTSQRAIVGLGIASIIATILYLNTEREKNIRYEITVMVISFVAITFFGLLFRENTEHFLRYREVFFASIIVSLAVVALLRRKVMLFAITLIPIVFLHGIIVNPISSGLGAIYNKDIYKFIESKGLNNQENLWAFYGERLSPNYFIAAGLRVFDGAKYTPDLKKMAVLDPENKFSFVYNRYAHIDMKETVSPNDKPTFKLNYDDNYTIFIEPCSKELKEIGIINFGFNYKVDSTVNSCLAPLNDKPINGFWLYSRK